VSIPKMPWQQGPLDEWLIVGMNHYVADGQRRLFVAMVRDGRCIKEEGPDDQYLWNRLWHKATANRHEAK
jgi:hypothetical protein